ncbi:minor capsid protein [Paenibacillus barengoltzii]|uniref:minor capsid protein n=1 Tax=Paenibacillus barengoltzii TaxID=343517 RepID=UPI000FD6D2D2|nr:minor capsid protein [Paenibacillus barengoltzii]
MKPAEYWRKRAEINARAEHAKADLYISQLAKEYRKSVNTIVRDIEAFYARYASENQVSMTEAKKQLEKGELAEFKMTLEEFIEKAKDNADGRWTQQLNNVYYRTRISRYEALLTQIKHELEMLTGKQQVGFRGLLSGNYTDSYYRTLFDIHRGTGFGTTFAKVDDKQLEKVLYTDWAGSNFSKRIWGNRDKLAREIQTNLSQAFIRGDSLDKVVKTLRDRFEVSKSNAARLVRTESAHIAAEGTYDGYKASGVVKQYQFLATLDLRTSEICRSMDDRIFDLSEKEVGINWPPLHANCRSTTVAYFDDDEDLGERIARDLDGKVYYVPGNITYEEWKKQYVESSDDAIIKGKFESLIGKIPSLNPDYKKALEDRFAAGSSTAQRVYLDYVSDNVVKDSQFKGGAHYNPVEQVINMDFDEDLKNPRGPAATFFHEFGHYVDNMAAIRKLGKATYDGVSHIDLDGITKSEFKKAILRDVQDYMQNYAKAKGLKLREAQLQISLDLSQGNGALHSAISDIYGGATRHRIRGLYGHTIKYWEQLPNALEKEAFAHMFEASFDPTGKRAKLMREYLPKSFALFEKILEVI